MDPESRKRGGAGRGGMRAGAVAAAALLLAAAPASRADFTLGEHTWDHGPHPWTNEYGWTLLTTETSGGHTGGWLRVTFTNTTAGGGDSWVDIVHTSASNLYAGAWTTNMTIQFDFLAEDVSPTALQVRWKSATNSYVWGYAVTPPATQTWVTYRAPLENWQSWDVEPFGSEDQFLADLASVDWVGVYIFRSGMLEQDFGIDDFGLHIPEPGQVAMLAMALASSAVSMRRRKKAARGVESPPGPPGCPGPG